MAQEGVGRLSLAASGKPGAGYKRQAATMRFEAEREEAAGAKKWPCLSLTSGADMEGPGKASGECGHSHPDKCVPDLLKCPTTRHTHRLFGMPIFKKISHVDLAVEIQVPWSPKPSICREPLPCRAPPPQAMLDHYQTADRPVSTTLRMASSSNYQEISIIIKILINKDHPAIIVIQVAQLCITASPTPPSPVSPISSLS